MALRKLKPNKVDKAIERKLNQLCRQKGGEERNLPLFFWYWNLRNQLKDGGDPMLIAFNMHQEPTEEFVNMLRHNGVRV